MCSLKTATIETINIVDKLFPFDQPCMHATIKKIKGVDQPNLCRLSECLDAMDMRDRLARVHGIIVNEKQGRER